ncbi:MAG TPA: alpha/beta fold hydrolase [Solirubrobacteraceae bacterium]|nr:alpha/beta fold hydrolase [Solirubrobacteraceae bacterium]
MRRAARTLASAFLVVAACGALYATAAQAQIAWTPCGNSNVVACGHLTVPLNPANPSQGVITLAMRRHLSPTGASKDAVVALAGGPGQTAIPFMEDFTEILGPIVSTRDLIAFDQRGTGLSHPLSCPAFEHLTFNSPPNAIAICAGQIGPTRGLFTTAQTVADIEAIREAGGYEKLVLYGTSYGTKVAERYAQEYPSHVEALVLDSVVPPSGPEPLDKTTFAAVGRVLHQLCSGRACARITPEPVSDLARLVKRMGGGSLSERVIDGEGKPHTIHIASSDLIGILVEGDLDPILRAEFPAAVRAALHGDTAPLGRLQLRAAGGESEGEGESLAEGFDAPLYYSSVCDEEQFPWNPVASPRTRLREARAALAAQPASAFAPFTAANALALSDMPACAQWPLTEGAPETNDAPLPNVPTLILSGADDLRTPTANARQVAAQIPDSHLVVVPNTGHSVLGTEPTPCASNALQAMFSGKPIAQCAVGTPPKSYLPTPLPPRSLAEVAPTKGNHGLPGRTLAAVVETAADFDRQIALTLAERDDLESSLATLSVRTGGLRAGWGGIVKDAVVLHGYSYVPNVTVSGTVVAGRATLKISGSAAARGILRIDPQGTLTGVLAGKRVHLGSFPASVAEVGTSTLAFPGNLGDVLQSARGLAGLRFRGE